MNDTTRWKKSILPILMTATMMTQSVSALAAPPDESAKGASSDGSFVFEETDEVVGGENSAIIDGAAGELPANGEGTAPSAEVKKDEAVTYSDDEEVRVFIDFEGKSVIESGYSTEEMADSKKAQKLSDKLETEQDKSVEKISEEVLDGQELQVNYNFTLLTNAVSADVKFKDIESIEKVDGVAGVYIAPVYSPMDTANPQTITAGDMIQSYPVWASGYSGAGQRIAVIDTGIDADHPSFDGGAFDYGIEKTAEKNDESVTDYNLLTKEEIEAVLPKLNASKQYGRLSADNAFVSDKIPYAFNYVDQNIDITHDNDDRGDHGTHVSGIACANEYVPDAASADGYSKQESGVAGVAPDAQLLTMKVFGTGGGAYSDDYMAAIEDAILLKADAINLSLGSSSAGDSADSEKYINDIFDRLQGSDVVVSISAGNSGRWGDETTYGVNKSKDVNMDTVGSPGSYKNALTVASANNSGFTGYTVSFDGDTLAYYQDGSEGKNPTFASLDISSDKSGTDYDYVLLTGNGEVQDYDGLDVEGKVVLVKRGNITFAEKHMNAQAHGAVGCLVYNNTAGTIGMALSTSDATIPCASITQAEAQSIMRSAVKVSDSVYTGKITVNGKVTTNHHAADGYTMSDFSSVGVPGDLKLKPEITAPGGNIYSTLDHGTYGINSGTSMAAPSVSGMSALVAQYIKDKNLKEKTGLSTRTLSQSLLMSTAEILRDGNGNAYSPRSQGAGLGNVLNATSSPVYILMGDKEGNDGKVKAELGDDPDKTGVYTFSFDLYNMTDNPAYYEADSEILTEELLEGEYIGGISHKLSPKVTISADDEVNIYDLDNNGKVNNSDAKVLLQVVNGSKKSSLVSTNEDDFDFNKDGAVNTADVHDFLTEIYKGAKKLKKTAVKVEDKTHVDVTVKLTDADREYLDNFENGIYVDGFVSLDGDVDLSVPMLAFYGSWADSSMYEDFDFMKYKSDPEYAAEAQTYTGEEQTNYMTFSFGGEAGEYYYVPNMYAADDEYIEDRNALSSENGDSIGSFYFSLIRNASRAVATVTNAETGEEYFRTDEEDVVAAFYYQPTASWEETVSKIAMNWAGTDAKGNPVPEGTKVNITLKAVPAYYDSTENIDDVEGKGLTLNYSLTIDNNAPKITDIKETEDGKLELSVSDNRYTAAVLVVDHDKKTSLGRYALNQQKAGETAKVEFEYPKTVFYVKVIDYAGNIRTYRVNKSGIPDTEFVDGLTLDQSQLELVVGETAKLNAEVAPVSVLDDSVSFKSDNTDVLTVNQDGVVTAKAEGQATVTVTTGAKNTEGKNLTATCLVTVNPLSVGLGGIYLGSDDSLSVASFDTKDTKSITGKAPLQNLIISAAKAGGNLIGASQDQEIFRINPETGAEVKLADAPVMVSDMTFGTGTGYVYGVYGYYLLYFDPSNGSLMGAEDLSKYIGSDYLVGLAELEGGSYSGNPCDFFYGITKSGAIYQLLYVPGMGYGIEKIGSSGINNGGMLALSSLHYDAATDFMIYSTYNTSTGTSDIYALRDNYISATKVHTLSTFKLGSMPEGGLMMGLYQDGNSGAGNAHVTVNNKVFHKHKDVAEFKKFE